MSEEEIATAIRHIAYNAYTGVLIGNAPLIVTRMFERMTKPVPGDLVIETSTVWRSRGTTDLDAVGHLIRVEWEPVDFGPAAEPWNEEEEGRPHPTERCWYIRTLDGREFRWVNASFIAALTNLDEWRSDISALSTNPADR